MIEYIKIEEKKIRNKRTYKNHLLIEENILKE